MLPGIAMAAVSFVPMRENGGPTPSPGRPTAAPLTANTPLSMEKGTRMETTAGRRRSTRRPAPAAAEGKIERLYERRADATGGPAADPCIRMRLESEYLRVFSYDEEARS